MDDGRDGGREDDREDGGDDVAGERDGRGGVGAGVRGRRLVPTASRRFAIVLTLVYAVILGVALARHEMWRDELQAWMLARDSVSPVDLVRNMRYEGHPPLWHLVLWMVSRLSRAPEAMQLVQWLVSATTVYLVARFAPAPRTAKVLVAASYYLAFEYAVLSRSYGLGLLLLVVACTLLRTRRQGYGTLALVLALLALTSAFGLLLAAAFAAALGVDAIVDARLRRMIFGRRMQVGAIVLLAASLVGSLALIRPPPDAPFTANRREGRPLVEPWGLATSGGLIWRAYVPVPNPASEGSWNSNILRPATRPGLALALGLSALLVAVVALPLVARRPAALGFYVLATGALLAFSYLRFFGTQRHHGHLFLVLLAAVWLARSRMAPWPIRIRRLVPRPLAGQRLARVAAVGLHVLLGVQVLVTARMYAVDLRRPFSAAAAAAAYLRDSVPAGTPLAARPSPATSAVSGMLDRPFYYLDDGEVGTFVIWGPGRLRGGDGGGELEHLAPLLPADGSPMVLILNYPLADSVEAGVTARALAHTPSAVVRSEVFFLYELRRVVVAGGGG
ncbi:MAG: hypothetical protein ACYC2G_06925 [Gemmatimonadaceae bacterium]